MYIYRAKEEQYHNPEIGFYTAYCVEVLNVSGERILNIPDVFIDFVQADEFINLCNLYQPEPIHMEELCIDFIQQI